MKANEAPEKIYIACDVITEEGRAFILEKPVSYLKSVEYTRTDAFIEKACKWIRDNYLKYPSEDCADTTKFVMDFKNYIK